MNWLSLETKSGKRGGAKQEERTRIEHKFYATAFERIELALLLAFIECFPVYSRLK